MKKNPLQRPIVPQLPLTPSLQRLVSHAPRPAVELIAASGAPEESLEQVIHQIDDLDLARFLRIADRFDGERCAYAVTPNVDHLIRYHEDAAYRELYRGADYVLLDSRFAAYLLRAIKGLKLPVCPGADLLPKLLGTIVKPADRLVLVGGTVDQAQTLARQYGLSNLHHHNPPMGFINDRPAVEQCLEFIEHASPFRFCFVVVGSPQQELLAYELKARARARGLVLCLGASLNFLTGVERRAPPWLRHVGFEWLYRLLQDPRRLARRYLVRGPRIFGHLRRARFILRTTPS
ncbi:MAG: WecB/TagA/CpsF family glycosyltransferase [Steroidobacteraceae bacterium]